MTNFIRNGDNFRIASDASLKVYNYLPVGTYTVGFDQMSGQFFLTVIEDMKCEGKIYGRTNRHSDRIISTFESRDVNTGVFLTGEKGSGKTLMTKLLSKKLREKGIPTIVINTAFCGEGFNQFMQMINTPCMVVFDEFEKVYDEDDQQKLLTLFDGTYNSSKLFAITCNDKYKASTLLRNRPGRMFYSIDYIGLDSEFVREYCEDMLKDELKVHIDKVVGISGVFYAFNFDMLKALVEEMNRYNETPQEAMELLNARPESDQSTRFEVTAFDKNGSVLRIHDNYKELRMNPIGGEFNVYVGYVTAKKTKKKDYVLDGEAVDEESDNFEWKPVKVTCVRNLIKIDPNEGKYVYQVGEVLVVVKKKKEESYDYYSAL